MGLGVRVCSDYLHTHAALQGSLLQAQHDLRSTLAEGGLDAAGHVVIGARPAGLLVEQRALDDLRLPEATWSGLGSGVGSGVGSG